MKVELSQEEIANIGTVFDVAVKVVGLSNPPLAQFTLDLMKKLTIATQEKKAEIPKEKPKDTKKK